MVMSMFFLSILGTTSRLQSQEDSKPAEKKAFNQKHLTAAQMEAAMKQAGDEINRRFEKFDSLLDQREATLKTVEAQNSQLARLNARLKTILSRFPKDSVDKYEMEYPDPIPASVDTSKKKIEPPQVTAPKFKRSFFDKLFNRNRQ